MGILLEPVQHRPCLFLEGAATCTSPAGRAALSPQGSDGEDGPGSQGPVPDVSAVLTAPPGLPCSKSGWDLGSHWPLPLPPPQPSFLGVHGALIMVVPAPRPLRVETVEDAGHSLPHGPRCGCDPHCYWSPVSPHFPGCRWWDLSKLGSERVLGRRRPLPCEGSPHPSSGQMFRAPCTCGAPQMGHFHFHEGPLILPGFLISGADRG